MKTNLIIDIETGPLPDDVLLRIHGPFDPASVKLGNAGPEKAAEKIAEAEKSYLGDLRDKAALDPMTGRVLAIGYHYPAENDTDLSHNDDNEAALLTKFWAAARYALDDAARVITFNGHGFDLPFLVNRSRLLGVEVPRGLLQNNRYWHASFVDLMLLWTCGQYGKFVGLDKLAKAFGLEGKTGDGAHFYQLWNGGDKGRAEALAYLANDLKVTTEVAKKMRVI